MSDGNIPGLRSGKNSHLLFLYWGDESHQNLTKALKNVLIDLQTIRENGNKVEVFLRDENGRIKKVTVKVTVWLTCDMVCLCKVLGLGSVYHPRSKYCCPWCEVTRTELGDFRREKWPFRTIEEMQALGAEQAKKSSPLAADAKGLIVLIRILLKCTYI